MSMNGPGSRASGVELQTLQASVVTVSPRNTTNNNQVNNTNNSNNVNPSMSHQQAVMYAQEEQRLQSLQAQQAQIQNQIQQQAARLAMYPQQQQQQQIQQGQMPTTIGYPLTTTQPTPVIGQGVAYPQIQQQYPGLQGGVQMAQAYPMHVPSYPVQAGVVIPAAGGTQQVVVVDTSGHRLQMVSLVVLLAGFCFPPIWWASFCFFCCKCSKGMKGAARGMNIGSAVLGALTIAGLFIMTVMLAVLTRRYSYYPSYYYYGNYYGNYYYDFYYGNYGSCDHICYPDFYYYYYYYDIQPMPGPVVMA